MIPITWMATRMVRQMNKKQFYYLVNIMKELVVALGVSLVCLLYPQEDSSLIWPIVIVGAIAFVTERRIRSYIKKAFDKEDPSKDEQEEIKEIERE